VAAPSALFGAPVQATAIEPPRANGQPITIKVGVYILNLVALDEVSQTFTCTGYLTQTWRDPRLAFSPSAGKPITRRYRRQDIWFPLLQFDNSAAPRTLSSFLLVGTAEGTIHYVEKFAVRLSTNMNLRAFPFDSQELQIYIHPFTRQESRIVLSVDPQSTGLSSASYTPLPLWRTGRITYRSVRGDETGYELSSHVVFAIHVVRNSEYYTFRIFVPLALMVAVSWGVLWIPPDDLNSQLMISVTTTLTLVAFSVALSNILPPVAYLTFYDVFFLVCFLFILLTIGEALIVNTTHREAGHAAALRIRRVTRRLLPPSFVAIVLLLAHRFITH
jgi:Neurotransmitter-gated ion-channel ligand binding domain/Neurotransmitter-gated ion-channel transmembrane region